MEDNNRRSARNYQSLLGRLEDNGAEREILQVRLAHMRSKKKGQCCAWEGEGSGSRRPRKKEKKVRVGVGEKVFVRKLRAEKGKGEKRGRHCRAVPVKKRGGDSLLLLVLNPPLSAPGFLRPVFPPPSLF